MTISVVIPVLDEAAGIRQCLTRVLALDGISQCIVVDGGSQDDTVGIARTFSVHVLQGPRGRGSQLALGATRATGQVLLFLHADTLLPDNAAAAISHALGDPDVVAGAFRTWTVPDHQLAHSGTETTTHTTNYTDTTNPRARMTPLGWLLHLADFRSRYSRLPYGDQGLFVRTEIFRASGGFPDVPLMEDLALSRKLWSFGRVQVLDERIRVSGRRFESSPLKQTLWVNLFPFLHNLGVSTRRLAQLYGNPR